MISLARIITMLASVVAAAAGLYWFLAGRAGDPPAAVETLLDDTRLLYAPAYARFPAGQAGGRLNALELAATFPKFAPAGALAVALPASGARDIAPIVFLSLRPHDKNLVAPQDRTAQLYASMLSPDVVDQGSGLVMRSFQDGSAYEGEDLFFAPPDGQSFAARCPHPSAKPDGLPDTCLYAAEIGPLDVDVRFSRDLLPQWERIADGARALVQSMLGR
ncbi:MAG: hypothetical protein KGL46_10915 [Hyphomicrobiales bacterium]|nr:hypothetical protein [Hyphomicrobiales bacterium]